MSIHRLTKMQRYQTEMVLYPISRFEAGYISVTEGKHKIPVCMLLLPTEALEKGTKCQHRNAEIIKQLPLIPKASTDLIMLSEFSEKNVKRI